MAHCPKCGTHGIKKPKGETIRRCRHCGPLPTRTGGIGVPHPNQLALCICAQTWIEQSQDLTDRDAADRLTVKINSIQEKIQQLSVAAFRDEEPPVEVAGLSIIDLMAAQGMLAVERAVRLRFANLPLQAAA